MLEGDFWSLKLRPLLKKHVALRDAVIVKHANQYAGGLPDFSITIGRHTEFFEVKIAPNKLSPLQAYNLKRLGEAGHLITVYEDSISLDAIKFLNPNRLALLVEEIVALCKEKI